MLTVLMIILAYALLNTTVKWINLFALRIHTCFYTLIRTNTFYMICLIFSLFD